MQTTGEPVNVLLIEDNPTDVRLVQELLRDAPNGRFTTKTASTLAQGLERLSSDDIDVVLLDLGLPDSQGLDSLHALRKRAPHLPIIVLTVSDDDAIGLAAVQAGAQQFLSKDALTLGAPYAGVFTRMIRYTIEQKRVEATLRKSEEELQTLFEASPIAQIRYDATGTPIVVNSAAREFLGIDDVSAISHLNIFTSPRVPDADKARLRAGKSTRYEQTYDFDAIARNGSFSTTHSGVGYVLLSLAPIFDTEGVLEAYLAQIVDVTARKHAEDALQDAHEEVQVLNEELQSTNEELRVANEELEHRVQERTVKLQETSEELASMNEELQATNEELRVSNEELRHETGERTRAEKVATARARQQEIINRVIKAGNEADTLPQSLPAMLDAAMELVNFTDGAVFLLNEADSVTEQRYARGFNDEVLERARRIPLTTSFYAEVYEGTPKFFNEYPTQGTEQFTELLPEIRILALVPLFAKRRVIGHYVLASTRESPFTDEERALLIAIGQQAGTVIARLQAEDALKESEARFRSLVERNFDGVAIHSDGIVRYANAAAARIWRASSPDELIGMSAFNITTPEYRELMKERVQEIYRTHKSSDLIEIQINTFDGSTVDIELSGAFITYRGKRAIYVIARDISERKRLEAQVQESARRQELINRVITTGNEASDLQTACAAMLDVALELLNFTNGGIFLRDGDAMTLQYEKGYTDKQRAWTTRVPITQPRVAQIMDGTPWISEDYQADAAPELREMNKDVASMATIPLVAGHTVVGMYHLVSLTRPHQFSSEERDLLLVIGQQAGTVIARLQAEDAAKEHARTQSILTNIITAGNKAPDLTTACAAMLDTALDLLPLHYGCIFLLDEQTHDAVTLQSSHGYTEQQLEWAQRIPLNQRLTARVMAGAPLFYDDYQAVASPDALSMNSEVQSMTFIPLMSGGTVLGFYNLGSRDEQHCFAAEEQALLIAVGQEAGTVIARLQAEEGVRTYAERIDLLNGIIQYGNTATDTQSFLKHVVTLLTTALDYDSTVIRLLNEADNVAELKASVGLQPSFIKQFERISLDDPVLHSVYRGKPYFSAQFAVEHEDYARASEARVVGAAPLVAGEKIIGNLSVAYAHHRPFSDDEKALLVAIGQEAGTVIARLQAEEAALQRAAMLDGAHDAVVMWSVDDRITYWNTGAERLYGWPRDEVIGQNVHTLLKTTSSKPLKRIRTQLTKTGRWEGELVHKTRSGASVTVESHMTLQRVLDGTPVATLEINTDVTRRKKAEERVRTASLYARKLIEASLDPLVTISAEGKITDVNMATEKVTGYSRDTLIGSDFSSYFTEPTKADVGYKKVFTDGAVRDYPLAIRHKSGSVTDVLYNAVIYLNEAGEIQGVFAAARDVTERTRAEKALKESEVRYRSLVERNYDGVIIHSDGIIRYANDAAARFMRATSPDELVGTGAIDIVTPKYRALMAQRVQEIYRTGTPSDLIEVQVSAPDGTIADVELSGALITHEGKPAIYVVVRDISERKQMEAQLKQYSEQLEDLVEERTTRLTQSEEEFRSLFEESSIAQIRYDAGGLPVRMNSAAARLFGVRDVSDIRHRNMFASIQAPQEDMARLREGYPLRFEQVYDFQAIRDGDLYPTTRSDVCHFDLYVLPLMGTAGTPAEGYLAQIVDLTDLREAEAALKNAERLAGIGQTAAMIGHDLRNPLQGLQYIVDLQKLRFERTPPETRGAEDWKKEQALFNKISEQVFYMDKIVSDLSDYARPIAPEHEEIAIRTIIDDVLESLSSMDGVETVINVSDLTFSVDPHLMVRVFSNLILNAVQAMPQGGTLTISAEASDDSVAIRVSDSGAGVPADMHDKLFSPLTTGKAKGTGLGLAVVKRIVEAHNGTIEFESEEGKGTTFTVTLPYDR